MTGADPIARPEVSLLRLYVMRAAYLLIFVGLALTIWPGLLRDPQTWPLMNGVVSSILGAVCLLALIGIRYPLQMLPLLLFELLWKSIWLIAIALPLWRAGGLEGASAEAFRDCLMGVAILPFVIPWGYVARRYARHPGDRWR